MLRALKGQFSGVNPVDYHPVAGQFYETHFLSPRSPCS